MCRQRRPKKGSYDAKFVRDFLMNDGNNGKNNTPTEVLMLPAGKTIKFKAATKILNKLLLHISTKHFFTSLVLIFDICLNICF